MEQLKPQNLPTLHTRVTASKEIKKTLSKLYPGIKFSVTSQSFANGNSIDVDWNLGPTTEKVDQYIQRYCYGRFDSMTDYAFTEDTIVSRPDGSFAKIGGAKFVTANRSYQTQEEIANNKIGWRNPGWVDLFAQEKTLYHIVGRDLCKAAGIEYLGLNMVITDNVIFHEHRYAPDSLLRDIVYQVLSCVDLMNGYHGVKRQKLFQVFNRDTGAMVFEGSEKSMIKEGFKADNFIVKETGEEIKNCFMVY